MPPTFFITTSRFTLPVGVGGVLPENQKICIKTEAYALRKVYAIFGLDDLFHEIILVSLYLESM
jgi:hypothetical protein